MYNLEANIVSTRETFRIAEPFLLHIKLIVYNMLFLNLKCMLLCLKYSHADCGISSEPFHNNHYIISYIGCRELLIIINYLGLKHAFKQKKTKKNKKKNNKNNNNNNKKKKKKKKKKNRYYHVYMSIGALTSISPR